MIPKADVEKRCQEHEDIIAKLREEKEDLEGQIKTYQEGEDNLSQVKSSIKSLRKYADQILVATQRMPMSQKREFLKECFEGNRIPVRTLTLGEVYDSKRLHLR